MKKKSFTSQAKLLVVAITGVAYIASVTETLVRLYSLQSVSDISGWALWFILGQILPVVILVALWFVTKGERTDRIYQAVVATIATSLFVSSLLILIYNFAGPALFSGGLMNLDWTYTMSAITFAVWVIVGSFFILKMRSFNKPEKLAEYAQLQAVYAASLFMFLSFAQTAYNILQQLPYNQNLSGFNDMMWFIGGSALLFVPAYVFARRENKKHPYQIGVFTALTAVQSYVVFSYPVAFIFSIPLNRWLGTVIVALLIAAAIVCYRWLYKKIYNLFL